MVKAKTAPILWGERILDRWIEDNKPRYSLTELLGEGGFSKVFKGKDNLDPRRKITIKISHDSNDDEVFERYNKEKNFLANKDHPNLRKMYDGRICDGHAVQILEYADRSLEGFISLNGDTLRVEEAQRIMNEVCSGISFIHSIKDEKDKFILHRDIKPSNIVSIGPDNKIIKIADLGCIGGMGHTTGTHGTDPYRALEGFDKNFCIESDVYSLGIVLYFLFCKKTPFQEETKTPLQDLKKNEGFIRSKCKEKSIDNRVAEVIVKATMPYQTDRYHSVEEFRQALMSLSINMPSSGTKILPPFEVPPPFTPPSPVIWGRDTSTQNKFLEIYTDLTQLLSRGNRDKYDFTPFEDIENIYRLYEQLDSCAKKDGFTARQEYRDALGAYERRVNRDIELVKKHLAGVEKTIGAGKVSEGDYELVFHVTAIGHLWGAADERVSLAQINDGALRKHYDKGLPKNDPELKKK